MIRIELVSRRLQKLIKRGAIMIAGGVAVVAVVFVVNRMLTSSPAVEDNVALPKKELTATVEDPIRDLQSGSAVERSDAGRRAGETTAARPELSRRVARENSPREVRRDQTPRRRRVSVNRDGASRRSRRARVNVAAGSADLVWSQACQQILQLYARMPRAIRFKSLTGNVTGEYAIEGLTSSSRGALSQVQDTLRAYTQLDSVPALWDGMAKEDVRFTFRGRFVELEQQQLTALSPSQAEEVLRQVPTWARNSGLREVKVKDPIAKSVADAYSRYRQKIWGRGSHRQISDFVESFQQIGQQATLGEMVVIPVYEGTDSWSNALLYAAVDILVYK